MRRRRIIIINYEFPPVGGGAARATYQLVRRLAKRDDLECHVIFGIGHDTLDWPRIPNTYQYPVAISRRSVHETGVLGMVQFLMKALPLLRKIAQEHDIELIHYIFSIPTGVLSFVQPQHIPYVVSLHGGDVPGFVKGEQTLLHVFALPFNKWIIRRAARVIAVSNSLATAARRNLNALTCAVIPNGVELGPVPVTRSTTGNPFRLCCVARLNDWKRIDLLITSLRDLPDVTLNIVGTGRAEESLRRLTRRLNLDGQVTFSGHVFDAEIRSHLDNADAFALPSIGDSFGIVFLEAMAAGLPIVAARACGVPEVVRDGVNGILAEPNDLISLTDAIRSLKENPAKRAEFAKASRQIAASHFSWDAITDSYASCYLDILNRANVRVPMPGTPVT